jgi:putative ABC transport system permease protein
VTPAGVPLDGRFAAVLAGLALIAVAASRLAGLGVGRAVVGATLRAGVQLTIVSFVIVVVLRTWASTVGFAVVMFGVATVTSAHRIVRDRSGLSVAVAIGIGVVPVLALLLAGGAVPRQPIVVVPIVGILVGGAMTATSLAGRRAVDALTNRYGEYQAALALGFTDRDAARLICQPTAREALLPALDQTRTVGLVTLPGAFVGVLLGGGGPLQAGAVQLLVLVALLAVETLAAVVTTELVARGTIRWRAALVGATVAQPSSSQARLPRPARRQ